MSVFPVALVTGGARRIGAAISRHLHSQGFNIVIHYNQSSEPAIRLASKLNQIRPNSAVFVQADLNNFEQIVETAQYAVSVWGRIDVLINNASTFYPTPVSEATEKQWDDLLNSNLKAPFFLSQQLQEDLNQSKGCIVNIADIFAFRPMPKHSIYSIAKSGNTMLTQALALEFAPHIRVNSVAPGAILWPEDNEANEIINLKKLETIPLNRLGGTTAITEAVSFLITKSPYTTGQVIRVDGGRSLT